jgi:hypothetical protein
MTSPNCVYRLRPMRRLLGSASELALEEFHLSSFDELNDPMEGYQDVLWRGDEILWMNLLRHYVLCLLISASDWALVDDTGTSEPKLLGAITEHELPTDSFRETYHDALTRFLADPGLAELSEALASFPVPLRQDSLSWVLASVHLSAFAAVTEAMRAKGLVSENWTVPANRDGIAAVNRTLAGLNGTGAQFHSDHLEDVASTANDHRSQQSMRLTFQSQDEVLSAPARRKRHLLLEFPDAYVREIARSLIHPDWHVLCFAEACTNASMWSTYGDEHKGAALIFQPRQTEGGLPHIALSGVIGSSASVGSPDIHMQRGPIAGTLHKVQYKSRAPQIDFFQFLGRLPRPSLEKAWYMDESGRPSGVVDAILKDENAWREALWSSFREMATTKLSDWAHECEHRIVLPDLLGSRSKHRKVRFDFSQLIGIVFGVRAPIADKLEVMRLVEAKCRKLGRTNFLFYQMRYSASRGCLVQV